MGKKTIPVYTCDTADCRSQCQLDPTEPDLEAALTRRGWSVDDDGSVIKYYCPGCVMNGRVPVGSDAKKG